MQPGPRTVSFPVCLQFARPESGPAQSPRFFGSLRLAVARNKSVLLFYPDTTRPAHPESPQHFRHSTNLPAPIEKPNVCQKSQSVPFHRSTLLAVAIRPIESLPQLPHSLHRPMTSSRPPGNENAIVPSSNPKLCRATPPG